MSDLDEIPSNQVPALCPDCQHDFYVPRSMQGGLANCPKCNKAVKVEGGIDFEFVLILGGALAVIFVLAGSAYLGGGLVPGLVMLGLGLLMLIIWVLAS